ncbi:MAG: thiamine-binding protein [Spirochaetaceae bacterium]|jgi:uncharacterized protein YqgV (UPF0045/DUF77 family)|nr:thiamine-binding protein [Spirochaetaceae bacterium]
MERPEASIAIQALPRMGGGANNGGKNGGEKGTLRVIDTVIAYIKERGLRCFVGPFETVIEGSADALWDIARECQKICVREGAKSVSLYMKFEYNPTEGTLSIEEKTSKYHA